MAGDKSEADRRWVMQMIENAVTSRQTLLSKFTDPRRNIEDECGYPKIGTAVDKSIYTQLCEREAIPARIVQVLPRESWQVQPTVYESENVDNITEFETAWDEFGRQLRGEQSYYQDEKDNPVWELLLRADILSGIGQYGVILIGTNDGLELSEPIAGVIEDNSVPAAVEEPSSKNAPGDGYRYGSQTYGPYSLTFNRKVMRDRRVLYMRAFPESLAQIIQFESNWTSPRFGQPVMYNITFNDPSIGATGLGLPIATRPVHWTRIIHLADNLESSEVFGVPRLRPVLNRVLDLQKLYGGSAEMYWRGAFPGISIETHPQLGSDIEISAADTKDMMENYMNGLQRYLALIGMSAKSLAPQVVDPSPQIRVQLEAICIQLGIPMRVFMGSERGELASTQDDAAWNDRLRQRQKMYITPRIIIPLIDRLIAIGVLPVPKGYSVEWPDLTSQTDGEKASVSVQRANALSIYTTSGSKAHMTEMDFYTRIMKFNEDEAATIVEHSQADQESTELRKAITEKMSAPQRVDPANQTQAGVGGKVAGRDTSTSGKVVSKGPPKSVDDLRG